MNKEVEQHPKTEVFTNMLGDAFVQRKDLYSRQLEDGSYVCIHKPLQDGHLLCHLKGEITLGTYCLDQESKTRFVVVDADNDLQLARLTDIARSLAASAVPAYLEGSRRGGHLWLFFEQPVPGQEARTFGRGLLKSFGLTGIELYPKQDRLADGPGSLIRLPFGVHRRNGLRYGFFALDGQPLAATLADQIRMLSAPKPVPRATFEYFATFTPTSLPKPPLITGAGFGEKLSDRVKTSVSVLSFISQYVELSASGRGRCPFHDDQHASFSVNVEKNYWHCFAGCGGGSIIDFWSKWREKEGKDKSFVPTVRELAKMLM